MVNRSGRGERAQGKENRRFIVFFFSLKLFLKKETMEIEPSQMERGPRVRGRGGKGKRIKMITCRYQLPTINAIVCYKRGLIKNPVLKENLKGIQKDI